MARVAPRFCGDWTTKNAAELDAANLHRALFVDNKTIKVQKRGELYRVCYKHFKRGRRSR